MLIIERKTITGNRPFFEELVPKFLVAQMSSNVPPKFFRLIYIKLNIIAHKFLVTLNSRYVQQYIL